MLKLCTAESMLSNVNGLGMRRAWYPRVITQAFLEADEDKEGEIARAPDPVTMIEGELSWFNNTGVDQWVTVFVHRAPRSIVTSNPITVLLLDGWSWKVGRSPAADRPTMSLDAFGGKQQIDRPSVSPSELKYGRLFLDGDDSQRAVPLGIVRQREAFHFRYLCGVQTPGAWITTSDQDSQASSPQFETQAHWTRLIALAAPMVTA